MLFQICFETNNNATSDTARRALVAGIPLVGTFELPEYLSGKGFLHVDHDFTFFVKRISWKLVLVQSPG